MAIDHLPPNGWKRTGRRLWHALFVLLFALWWGGLTFYAAIVVPIGSDLIGSTEQGFITQQVTRWHNGLLLAMIVYLTIDAWKYDRRGWIVVVGLATVAGSLHVQHNQLTESMELATRTVASRFYPKHAIYLWLTTVEWTLGLLTVLLRKEIRSHSDRPG